MENQRQINSTGLSLIKQWEGCRLTAYSDMVGVTTIGYGHTGSAYQVGQHIDQNTADALLDRDLRTAEAAVSGGVSVPLTDNQFSALVCLVFNIGATNFRISGLLKNLNAGKYLSCANHFLLWDRAGGKEVEGLLHRRQAERELFLS